jgi:hypothetical protein
MLRHREEHLDRLGINSATWRDLLCSFAKYDKSHNTGDIALLLKCQAWGAAYRIPPPLLEPLDSEAKFTLLSSLRKEENIDLWQIDFE